MEHVDEYPSTSSNSSPPPEPKNMDSNDTPKKVVFGIDLGGTYARVALIQPKENNKDGFVVTFIKDIPSVVSFQKDSDGKCLIGLDAEKRAVGSPLNTFYATKRLIGRSALDDPIVQVARDHVGYTIVTHPYGDACVISLNGSWILTTAQIEALILLKLQEFCERELSNTPMENIMLTVPPYFNDKQKQVIKEAASIAGLNVVGVINTPVAAVLAYSTTHETLHGSKTVAVYDFGGTSFCITILKISEDATDPEVISTMEDLFLGGEYFDEKLVNYLVTELKSKTGIDAKQCKTTMQYFKLAAKKAKIDLSYCTGVDVNVFDNNLHSLGLLPSKHDRVTIKVTRNKFEELVAELISKTIGLCQKALEDAKISVSEIDEVIAIGGICKIPKVQATVEEFFGKVPIGVESMEIDRANAVVAGAAFRGHILASEISKDQQLPAPSIYLPEFVKEGEVYDFVISDDLDLDQDADLNSSSESYVLDIAECSIVCKTCNLTSGNPPR
ncbi:heat shock 70 kDa protein cognate 5-like [Planococcus citri]|uniref:heat shock 70 kDa protein cognate 5-like n=1 Tax=Planococcus citri TaxID=170843 RepID=UPI0031F89ED9